MLRTSLSLGESKHCLCPYPFIISTEKMKSLITSFILAVLLKEIRGNRIRGGKAKHLNELEKNVFFRSYSAVS